MPTDVNPWLAASAGLGLLTVLIHWVLGGKLVARQLLKAGDLDPVARFSAYSTWHQVTLTTLAIAVALALAATQADLNVLAVFAVTLSGVLSLWNLALVIWKRQSLLAMPQWLLFGAIAGLGVPGLA